MANKKTALGSSSLHFWYSSQHQTRHMIISKDLLPLRNLHLLLLGTLVFVGFSLRLYKSMVAPITYDEAYSFLNYSLKSVGYIFTDYTYPNNHILNSLILKFVGLFSERELALRFHSTIGFLILIMSSIAISRRIFGFFGVFLLTLFLTFEPILFDFSTLARGYSLGLGLTFFGYYYVIRYFECIKYRFLLFSSICFILALGAVPTLVNPVGGFFLALVALNLLYLAQNRIYSFKGFAYSQAILLLGLYLPTIGGAYIWYIGIDVDPGSIPFGHMLFYDAMKELFIDRWELKIFEKAGVYAATAFLGLVVITTPFLGYFRRLPGATLLGLTTLGTLILIFSEHFLLGIRYPNPRMWIYIIPLLGFCFIIFLESLTRKKLIQNILLATATIIIFNFQMRIMDLNGSYPWKHLVQIKSGLSKVTQESVNPKICYAWIYDMPFKYYQRVYKYDHIANCNSMTYVFDHTKGGMIKIR